MLNIFLLCAISVSALPIQTYTKYVEAKIVCVERQQDFLKKQLEKTILRSRNTKGIILTKYEHVLTQYLKILDQRHSLLHQAHMTLQQVAYTDNEIQLLSQIVENASTLEIFLYFQQQIQKKYKKKEAYLREAHHYILQDYLLIGITPILLVYNLVN